MRIVLACLAALLPCIVQAQTLPSQRIYPGPAYPAPGTSGSEPAPMPQYGPAGQSTGTSTAQGGAQQSYGGCYGCSYVGDYRPSAGHRHPAPPLRLQGEWRNGWWYY